MSERSAEFYSQTYDLTVPDWPGEMDFYRQLVAPVKAQGGCLLEIACGTGRVSIRLAEEGLDVVGTDLSPEMLEVAQQKSQGLHNIRWAQGDMRTLDLGQQFDLVISPGHSFQFLNTPEDQAAAVECFRRHLKPTGKLVLHLDHQDFTWLGDLMRDKNDVFELAESFQHPDTGHKVQAFRAWRYEPATQSAICTTKWEEIDENGQVYNRWQRGPNRLHCVFRFEMEHLFVRTGFIVEAVYGDFFKNPLQDKSPQMIWVARPM